MEDLFRVAFNRLTRDIKYQLERASMRNRDLNVVTTVRADVLTERMIHPWPQATGWGEELAYPSSWTGPITWHLSLICAGYLASLQIAAPLRGQRSACYTMGTDLSQRDTRRAKLRPGEELRSGSGTLQRRGRLGEHKEDLDGFRRDFGRW